MKVRYSDGESELPLKPLGNGRVLAWIQGAELFSLRMGYSSPHLCSLYPELSGSYHETVSGQSSCIGEHKTKLYYSERTLEASSRALCDLEITDTAIEGKAVFRRRMDGISPMSWKLVLPGYVRCVYHSNYRFGKLRADTIFLTIPAGTPTESGLATQREQNAAVLLCGSLRYDAASSRIHYTEELGEICFLSADDPSEMVREGDCMIASFNAHCEKYERQEPISDIDPEDGLLQDLRAMIAKDGIVSTSHREPFGSASDLPAIAEVLFRAGDRERLCRMLLRWSSAVCESERFPARLQADRTDAPDHLLSDYTAAASYLLAASRAMTRGIAEGKDADLIFRGMRSTFALLLQGMRGGMLPFSTHDRAMEAGIFARELLFQGSAESTALAIAAVKAYLQYCKQSERRAAHDLQKYRAILSHAESQYESNFVRGGRFYRNSPALEGISRRPRFIRSICVLCQQKGAYPFEELLELDKYGRYLCRQCFASDRNAPEVINPGKRYPSARATSVASVFELSPTALAELSDYAIEYCKRNHSENDPLPVREGDTDPLVLLALWKRCDALLALWNENDALLQKLIAVAKEWGFAPSDNPDSVKEQLWTWLVREVRGHLRSLAQMGVRSALFCDKSSLGSRSAAGVTALCYLALQATRSI